MIEIVQERLEELEAQENVRIIYAVESGSRAWGFPSTDSDYDVRFIYAHPQDWYLSVDIERKRDVIQTPIDDKLDVVGWDLRKALKLLEKSNPPLLEWLTSPIVYSVRSEVLTPIRQLAPRFFTPSVCLHHYRRIARQEHKKYLEGSKRQLKKYFYALRCALAYKWVEQGLGIVPMPFEALVNQLIESTVLKKQIAELVELKRVSRELDTTPQMKTLNKFVERELAKIETAQINGSRIDRNVEELNQYFRHSLEVIWEN